MDSTQIIAFLHEQVRAWNAGDKAAFFAAYRAAAPQGLRIEYVGKPEADGWPILENMWEQQAAKFEVEEGLMVPCGQEVACHNRNKVRGTTMVIETVEIYRFEAGRLTIRYFIQAPQA